MMLNVTFPHKPFNAAVKDGSIGAKIGKILEASKPEAVYFSDHHGQRSATLIVEVADASKIPALAEPWFLVFEANFEARICMTPEDLKHSGLDSIGKLWC